MNKKELLILSVGVFLTIIAWMIIDIYHIKTSVIVRSKIKSVRLSNYQIDKKIIDILKEKKQ